MKRLTCSSTKLFIIAAFCLVVPLGVSAQPQTLTTDQFAGNYKGTAKMSAGEVDVTLEIKSAAGKVSGRAVTAESEYQITSGEVVGEKLLLKFDSAADSLADFGKERRQVGRRLDSRRPERHG
jgi:hypothetical protein